MKKKINLTVSVTKLIKREVEFPLYIRHEVDVDHECTIYHRVEEDLSCITVKYENFRGEISYELSVRKWSLDGSSEDYTLGRGEYALSASEFQQALEYAKHWVAALG